MHKVCDCRKKHNCSFCRYGEEIWVCPCLVALEFPLPCRVVKAKFHIRSWQKSRNKRFVQNSPRNGPSKHTKNTLHRLQIKRKFRYIYVFCFRYIYYFMVSMPALQTFIIVCWSLKSSRLDRISEFRNYFTKIKLITSRSKWTGPYNNERMKYNKIR